MRDTLETSRLKEKFFRIRKKSEELCEPLEIDDFNMQAMIYGSPPKWNLGHCTWAFEAFVLGACVKNYKAYNNNYSYIFNSYYETVGERIQRDKRYLLSRPNVKEVFQYRKAVDEILGEILETPDAAVIDTNDFFYRLELAINHEQQHQELFLTDLKHIFFESPLQPIYKKNNNIPASTTAFHAPVFTAYAETITEIGHNDKYFAYDNESGRHKVYLNPFALMNRPVTNGEFLDFVEDGGYENFRWWLSDAWALVKKENWKNPMYWENISGKWFEFTLHGKKELDPDVPVCHISFYEADAYARYKGKRLPTEFEWEYVASENLHEIDAGHFMDNGYFHPIKEPYLDKPRNFFGNIWEWTQSAYLPYPHYKPHEGAIGEYNGKFMNDQRVLRGGSCATPKDHIRLTYRNFFEGFQRWQFSGFRLAEDI